jgi:hypothetical protein
MTTAPTSQGENGAWYYALIGTLIYFLLFFPFLGIGIYVVVVAFEGHSILSAIWVIVMYPTIVLSFPASIYFMWRSYLKNLYDKTYLACTFPLLLIVIVVIIESLFRI